jgi:hypothetical protein
MEATQYLEGRVDFVGAFKIPEGPLQLAEYAMVTFRNLLLYGGQSMLQKEVALLGTNS